jgi:hypothetical protein
MAFWSFRRETSEKVPDSDTPRHEAKVLTFLAPKEVSSLCGLPNEGIPGYFVGDSASTEIFRSNPRFIEFMHQVIRTAARSIRTSKLPHAKKETAMYISLTCELRKDRWVKYLLKTSSAHFRFRMAISFLAHMKRITSIEFLPGTGSLAFRLHCERHSSPGCLRFNQSKGNSGVSGLE